MVQLMETPVGRTSIQRLLKRMTQHLQAHSQERSSFNVNSDDNPLLPESWFTVAHLQWSPWPHNKKNLIKLSALLVMPPYCSSGWWYDQPKACKHWSGSGYLCWANHSSGSTQCCLQTCRIAHISNNRLSSMETPVSVSISTSAMNSLFEVLRLCGPYVVTLL